MTFARPLLIGHAAAVLFALGGLLVALPHPELWAGSASAAEVFRFGMLYAGSLHIVLGTAAVFAFGVAVLGWRRTLVFFVAACSISLGSELVGTGTGWPFGAYEYTEGLGPKILGRVPFSIPLSWFYVGLTCYLLARLVTGTLSAAPRAWWSVALGAWFLVVWDLVLHPAMAHESPPLQFWVWHQTGPYFGMPIQNFVGWTATALLFMGLSRLLWDADPDPARIAAWFPLAVYAVNLAFAIALSASVGLWVPILLALVLGLLPANLAWRHPPTRGLRTRVAT
jgi:uncharacterized membrane protein